EKAVGQVESWPKGLEIDAGHDFAEIVVLRDNHLEHDFIEFGQRSYEDGFQHDIDPPETSGIDRYLEIQLLSCQMRQKPARKPPDPSLRKTSSAVSLSGKIDPDPEGPRHNQLSLFDF